MNSSDSATALAAEDSARTAGPVVPADAPARQQLADQLALEIRSRWAGRDLDRVLGGLDIWCYRKTPDTLPGQRAIGFYMPGLPATPWIDPERYPCAQMVREAYPAIREETARFMDGRLTAPPHGLPEDAPGDAAALPTRPEGWREWRMALMGRLIEPRLRDFPQTTRLLKRVMEVSPFLVNALFLTMRPGTVLGRHVDPVNAWSDLWLGLYVPEGAGIEVNGETRVPEEGGLLGFDHSFVHSAWNKGSQDRIVMSLLLPHPELTPYECEIAGFLMPQLTRFGFRLKQTLY
ncbi:MAG: aspartyl/asparaginyl beta-hydroxylase domain-containing protein [Luteimonas sp.]